MARPPLDRVSKSAQPFSVQIIQDDPTELERLRTEFERDDVPVEIDVAPQLITALIDASRKPYDCILLDLTLPDCASLDVLKVITRQKLFIPVVVMVCPDEEHRGTEALRSGVEDYVIKGQVSGEELLNVMRHAVERHRLKRDADAVVRELELVKARFRSLIVDNADAMLVIDRQGIVQLVNPAAETFFKRPASDFLYEVFGLPIEGCQEREVQIVNGSGEEITCDMRVMDTLWDGEKAYIATLRDISDRKRAEAALIQAKQVAENASELKSRFLANMSHELRTPLNSIIGFSEMIKSEMFGSLDQPKYQEYTDIIHGAGVHLLCLINELLDLSKAEAGELTLNENDVQIVDLIESAVKSVRARALQAKLNIKIDYVDSSRVNVDDVKLTQILLNLLTNAIKFTPEGGSVTITGAEGPEGEYKIDVIDTGLGVEEDLIPKIFTPFVQIKDSQTADKEGTGLGLALTKYLVELHDGNIRMTSQVGVGTTVSVTIPSYRVCTDSQPVLSLAAHR